jgi:hypothetical protein
LLRNNDSSLLKGTITDSTGNFQFEEILAGSFILLAQSTEYKAVYTKIENIAETKIFVLPDIVLDPQVNRLGEVVVSGKKRLFEFKMDRTVFNVQNSPAAAGLNALDLLARSPNIRVDQVNNEILMNGKKGLVVMMNGKTMRMEQSALLQYLNGLPAANIKKIEFIHTPPASMDAAGGAGVINIETIKNDDEGLNGNWSLNTGFSTRPKWGGSVNLNLHKGKINLYADFSLNTGYVREDVRNTTETKTGNLIEHSDLFSKRPAFRSLANGRIGLDYQPTKRTIIGLLISGYTSQWNLNASTETTTMNDTGYYRLSQLRSVENNNWKHLTGSLHLQHNFSEKTGVTIEADYLHFSNDDPTDYTDNNYDNHGVWIGNSAYSSFKKTWINFIVGSFDYSSNISRKLKIRAGLRSTISDFTNDIGVNRLVNGSWQSDKIFTESLILKENILAGYFSADYQPTIKSYLKLGLRYEKSQSDMTGIGGKKILGLDYGRLFPVISFSHHFNETTQLQFSYNERITRPPFNNIAPAFFFFGPNNILGGNPLIQPTISRQLTSSLRLKSLLFTLQLSSEENPIVFQPGFDPVNNFVLLRPENMKSLSTAMVSINYSTVIKWWSGQFNIAFYAQRMKPVINGITATRESFYMEANTTQSFKLPAEFTIELTNQTITAHNSGPGKIPFNSTFNLGVQKSLGKKNKLIFNCADILNTGSFYKYTQSLPDLNYYFYYNFEGPVFKLTLTHQFGSGKLKKAASPKVISEEEMKRVQ